MAIGVPPTQKTAREKEENAQKVHKVKGEEIEENAHLEEMVEDSEAVASKRGNGQDNKYGEGFPRQIFII